VLPFGYLEKEEGTVESYLATLWLPGRGGEYRATWLPCSYLEEEESRELPGYPVAT
jgi:hypothetical protein